MPSTPGQGAASHPPPPNPLPPTSAKPPRTSPPHFWDPTLHIRDPAPCVQRPAGTRLATLLGARHQLSSSERRMARFAWRCMLAALVQLSFISQAHAFLSVGSPALRIDTKPLVALRGPISGRPSLPAVSKRVSCCSLQMQEAQEGDGQGSMLSSAAKPALWAAWGAYMFHVFGSDSPCGPGATGDLCGISLPTMMEAINLSINFWREP